MKTIFEILGIVVVYLAVAVLCAYTSSAQDLIEADPADAIEPSPAETADQLFNTPAGHYVRIVGGKPATDAPVLPSPIGDAVNVPTVPRDAVCNVILDAVPVTVKNSPCRRPVPAVLELAYAFGQVSCPVSIDGSEHEGRLMWNVMLQGAACVTAADCREYVASSMAEFFPLEAEVPKWKCRVLRAVVEGALVSVCDPRVDRKKDRIVMPHGWAGRRHLNYKNVVEGELQPRKKFKSLSGGRIR